MTLFDDEEAFAAPLRLGTIETIAHRWFPEFMRRCYRLSLPVPLPVMHYDVIWRNANHPRFCRGVARLAQQCACNYAQSRRADMTTTLFSGRWVTASTSSVTTEATHS